MDREQSPAMMFGQRSIASVVLRWCLAKGRSQAKSCNDVWPRVDRERSSAMMFAPGRYAGACAKEDANTQGKMQVRKGRSAQGQVQGQFGELRRGNCERGTAKGEECWWQQMGIVKRGFRLVVRLIANECYRIYFAIYPSYRQPSGLHSLQSRPLIYRLHRIAPQDPSAIP